MGLLAAAAAAIHACTGLSPTFFFTILTLMVATYLIVSSLFVDPDSSSTTRAAAASITAAPADKAPEQEKAPEMFLPPEPVQVGEITLEQLRAYDGKDPKKQLLIAIKGNVYDVSRGRLFYGPQGHYSLFAGRDATRALALMSFDPEDLNGDIEDLSSDDLEVLQDWEEKFKEKYPIVGQLASQQARSKDIDENVEQLRNLKLEELHQNAANEAIDGTTSEEQEAKNS